MSNSHIDNLVNAVVNKISAVVNNHNSSSNAHSSILSDYLQTTDVKDNLTSTDTNKPLSAKQGKELKALIDAKEDNIEVITGSVKNSDTLQGTISASSLSGKLFIYILPSLSEVNQNADVVIHLTLNGGGTTISGGYVYKNGSILKYQELQGESWLLLANHGSLHVLSSSSYAEANHTHEVLLSSNDDSDIQLFNVSAQGYPQGEGQPLGAFLSEFWKKIYPVGSIYMSVNSTSPQTLFGGTWERIQDRFLLASGSTYSAGSTGGSADATLVSHYHGVSTTGEYFVTSSKDSANNTRVAYSSSGNRLVDGQTDTGNSSFHHRQYTTTQGSNGTGKNMPPYLSVYVWKRIA